MCFFFFLNVLLPHTLKQVPHLDKVLSKDGVDDRLQGPSTDIL